MEIVRHYPRSAREIVCKHVRHHPRESWRSSLPSSNSTVCVSDGADRLILIIEPMRSLCSRYLHLVAKVEFGINVVIGVYTQNPSRLPP